MTLLDLTTSARAYLREIRALSTDSHGDEIFVGLTHAESIFYAGYGERRGNAPYNPDEQQRYLALHTKHEIERLSVLGVEVEARDTKVSRH